MDNLNEFIFSSNKDFIEKTIKTFHFQYENNVVYKRFVDTLNCNPSSINAIEKIPYLPVSFFKTHEIKTTDFTPQLVFESSGTTATVNSRHFVKEAFIYESSFKRSFQQFYGKVKDYCILGLLPSYIERKGSSLLYMVQKLMEESAHPLNNFYLSDYKLLAEKLTELEKTNQKTLLIGVTYALLDFAEKFPMALQHTVVMETGGMKGRKKEMIRSDVHDVLKKAFCISVIHSEYGMTELLSQAYALDDGIFKTPPWMRIVLREEDDPLKIISAVDEPLTGAINIIDLTNIFSCSFIATDDAGKLYPDGSFEVLGRIDNSDIRGCSLMVL